ncbi:hypothetical protein [Lewinella sp. JB7]|uniref:hypothetical protein n=1 Tax=Lewinella sp. JB7 TaxID=2962887 RepID=UPI0020CA253D|nr:hypothetical protein [Lewinella sp. JB7]MCP9236083.1 hypothetical protein [Lewinella sp. JB7]
MSDTTRHRATISERSERYHPPAATISERSERYHPPAATTSERSERYPYAT